MSTVRTGPASPRARGRRPTARRAVAPLAAALFFFGPALAFVAGDRAVEIENRRLPEFPALSRGWDVIPDAEAWATAHLSLRRYAVRADAALSELLFGDASSHARTGRPDYPRVVEGRDGWLYFGDDVTEACRPRRPVADTLERLRRLAEIVRGSGRRFLVTVAPDKTTVYPHRLPERFPGQSCLGERKREFWAALRMARLPGYVDLRGPLERTQRDSGAPAYWRTDSHWTERSAGLYGAELARALDPGLSRHTRLVRTGRAVRDGDLGGLLGVPREETVERWRLDRDGVRRLRQDDRELPVSFRTANASGRASLYRPRTLLIGDSFTRNSLPWVLPYFADLTYLRSDAPATVGADQVAWEVARSETVVVEIVERHLVGGRVEMLDDAVLAALERAL
ncbi:alginate O-acetyltransferase AlgX-related protein [Sphaerisporangium flaviroseum]|uniref:alginate O-acetyltransferase AlgX-related protein n=1 Tax=Sphaerisporangium flaviroseum TaxID=509199 RepID=UPI0031ECD6DA